MSVNLLLPANVHTSLFSQHMQTTFPDPFVFRWGCVTLSGQLNVCINDVYDFKTSAVKSICAFPKQSSLLNSAIWKQRRWQKHMMEEARVPEQLNIAAPLPLPQPWVVAQNECCIQPLRFGESLLQQIFYSDQNKVIGLTGLKTTKEIFKSLYVNINLVFLEKICGLEESEELALCRKYGSSNRAKRLLRRGTSHFECCQMPPASQSLYTKLPGVNNL